MYKNTCASGHILLFNFLTQHIHQKSKTLADDRRCFCGKMPEWKINRISAFGKKSVSNVQLSVPHVPVEKYDIDLKELAIYSWKNVSSMKVLLR